MTFAEVTDQDNEAVFVEASDGFAVLDELDELEDLAFTDASDELDELAFTDASDDLDELAFTDASDQLDEMVFAEASDLEDAIFNEDAAVAEASPSDEPDEATVEALVAADNAAKTMEDDAVVTAKLKTNLIALRKREDSDQLEADVMFALSNTGNKALKDLSLRVAAKQHLGDAFVGIVGEPVFEIEPAVMGSWVAMNPEFNGFAGGDSVFLPGAVLRPKDSALVRMTVHYDQDALQGINPLSIRGDLIAKALGESYRFASDNGFAGDELDENGDGNPQNDSTPLPGIRLVKTIKKLPVPAVGDENPELFDAVFEYTIENTGGLRLHNLALADLLPENAAVEEVLDVQILNIEPSSRVFTATSFPDEFFGISNVKQFEGGDAVLDPGESVKVTAEVIFAANSEMTDLPVQNRAATFARVDLNGDGTLDLVLGDPLDAPLEGAMAAAPEQLGFARFDVSNYLDGKIVGEKGAERLILEVETEVRNSGVAPLENISVKLRHTNAMLDAVEKISKAPKVVAVSNALIEPALNDDYDGLSKPILIQNIPVLNPGDSVAVSTEFTLSTEWLDALGLLELVAEGDGELDRDFDGDFDLLIGAVQGLTRFVGDQEDVLIMEIEDIQFEAQAASNAEWDAQNALVEDEDDFDEVAAANVQDEDDWDEFDDTAETRFRAASDGEDDFFEDDFDSNDVSAKVSDDDDWDSDDWGSDEQDSDDWDSDDWGSDEQDSDDWDSDDWDSDDWESDDFDDSDMDYRDNGGEYSSSDMKRAPSAGSYSLQPRLVRKLIPGNTIAFPPGSVPVTVTSGFQLAVPQGYQAYQAPDGSFFLVRKR